MSSIAFNIDVNNYGDSWIDEVFEEELSVMFDSNKTVENNDLNNMNYATSETEKCFSNSGKFWIW